MSAAVVIDALSACVLVASWEQQREAQEVGDDLTAQVETADRGLRGRSQ